MTAVLPTTTQIFRGGGYGSSKSWPTLPSRQYDSSFRRRKRSEVFSNKGIPMMCMMEAVSMSGPLDGLCWDE